jgi:hypothetical protein
MYSISCSVVGSTDKKPTPFEVWKSKQNNVGKQKVVSLLIFTDVSDHIVLWIFSQSPKLTSEQWDGLVNHLFKTNKLKERYVYN